MAKKKYKVQGMHCTSCAMVIESDLEEAGIKAKCSFASSTLEVEFDPKKITPSKVKEIVKSAGYILQ